MCCGRCVRALCEWRGVDAIFIAPVVATGWEPVLKEAKEAKIPVILLDRGIDVKILDPSKFRIYTGNGFPYLARGRLCTKQF